MVKSEYTKILEVIKKMNEVQKTELNHVLERILRMYQKASESKQTELNHIIESFTIISEEENIKKQKCRLN